MLINYFSDIHLEFGCLELPENESDIIIAAGDIGIYTQGIEWLKKARKPVIYVAGNHEFYDNEHVDTLQSLRTSAKDSNVHFLENSAVVVGEVRFLGCTLWTELGAGENDPLYELLHTVNDFRKISYKDRLFCFEIYSSLHRKSKSWLIDELNKPFDGKTVIVTHHAPTYWSWDLSPNSLTKFAYCNDVRELFHEFDITAWFHGHTHSVSDYKCAGARVLCNPRGYTGRQTVPEFAPGKMIWI